MPRFAELEKQERSIILGLRRARRRARETGVSGARWSLFVTLKEGMEDLVAALATRLQPGTVLLKQRVAGVERRGDRWRVATAEGADLDPDRVIVATESHPAARMLRYVDPTLATLLPAIPYAPSAPGPPGYPRPDVPHPPAGFGL